MKAWTLIVPFFLLVTATTSHASDVLRVQVRPTRDGFKVEGTMRFGNLGIGRVNRSFQATKDRYHLRVPHSAKNYGAWTIDIPEKEGGGQEHGITAFRLSTTRFSREHQWVVQAGKDGRPIGAIGTVYGHANLHEQTPIQYDIVAFTKGSQTHTTYTMSKDGAEQSAVRRTLDLATGKLTTIVEPVRTGSEILSLAMAAAKDGLKNRWQETKP